MRGRDITIVQTGIANTASVAAALARCGGEPAVSAELREIERAELVVLPGVGAFGTGMARLRAAGLDRMVAQRIAADRPTLAVCLGMQLLCEASEESPGEVGMGVVSQCVSRFPPDVRAPQFGWNSIEPDTGCRMLKPGCAYFANSYRITQQPPGWSVAWSDHGGPFVAAMERGNILACQFHPELSGPWGVALLQRWIKTAEKAT